MHRDPREAVADVRRWVELLVIGEGLCPFARPIWAQTRVVTPAEPGLRCCLETLQAELSRLLGSDADTLPTTLLVVPDLVSDFEDYLDTLTVVEAAVAQAGLEGIIQVASFHPDYRFDDTEPDDLGNATNRAPWPIFHLLREADIEEAIEAHPDTESIPARNIAHLKALGRPRIEALLQRCRQSGKTQ